MSGVRMNRRLMKPPPHVETNKAPIEVVEAESQMFKTCSLVAAGRVMGKDR